MPNDHRRQISLLVDECDYWWTSKADLLNNCESKNFLQWRSMTVGLGFFLCCLASLVQCCKNNFLQTAYRSPSPPPVCFLMLAINCALKKIFAFFPLLFLTIFGERATVRYSHLQDGGRLPFFVFFVTMNNKTKQNLYLHKYMQRLGIYKLKVFTLVWESTKLLLLKNGLPE